MECSGCGGNKVRRVARRGLVDRVCRWLGRWPYRCGGCHRKFYGHQRFPPVSPTPPPAASAHYRVRHTGAAATVVVRAETTEQLDHILLALARAVSDEQYQPAGKEEVRAS